MCWPTQVEGLSTNRYEVSLSLSAGTSVSAVEVSLSTSSGVMLRDYSAGGFRMDYERPGRCGCDDVCCG